METCKRDVRMKSSRERFKENQISEKEFEQEILRANKVCLNCPDPVCHVV